MKTIPYFEISISPHYEGEVAIINNYTGTFAKQSLRSLKKIKRKFKVWLNNKNDFCFSHMGSKSTQEELQAMLPKHRLSV